MISIVILLQAFTFSLACLWPWILATILPFLLWWLFGELFGNRNQNNGLDAQASAEAHTKAGGAYSMSAEVEKELMELRYAKEELTKTNHELDLRIKGLEADKAVLQARLGSLSAEEHQFALSELPGVDADLAAKLLAAGISMDELVEMDAEELKGRLEAEGIDWSGYDLALIAGGATAQQARSKKGGDASGVYFELAESNLSFIPGIDEALEAKMKAAGFGKASEIAVMNETELKAKLEAAGIDTQGMDLKAMIAGAALLRDRDYAALMELDQDEQKTKALRLANAIDSGTGVVNYRLLFSNTQLEIIEGIDSGLAAEFRKNGIHTWEDLKNADHEHLRQILGTIGDPYDKLDPKVMQEQAEFAGNGDWNGLIAYQMDLDVEDDPAAMRGSKLQVLTGIMLDEAHHAGVGFEGGAMVDRSNYSFLFDQDNLQVVEGVGAKVSSILQEAGIHNWEELGNTSPEQLSTLLAEAKLHMMNPESWPRQAQLAKEGKWDELAEYQMFLDAGREDWGGFHSPAKVDQIATSILEVRSGREDEHFRGVKGQNYSAVLLPWNLQVIEGIGPKLESLLKKNGIGSLFALAKADEKELKKILSDNNLSMIDPSHWSDQAELAADGKWNKLAEFQKELNDANKDGASPAKVDRIAEQLFAVGAVRRGKGIDFGAAFETDHLQIIEGIGGKVEELLKSKGINSWSSLAEQSQETLKAVLEEAGGAYQMMDPGSWPLQARLAAEGKWSELIAFQKDLNSGDLSRSGKLSPSKLETKIIALLGYSNDPEDLTVIEGIGPKIEELLKEAGIKTWGDLAGASVENLEKELEKGGKKFSLAMPSTWPLQARLAHEQRWEQLREYQELLQGGREKA